MPLVDTPLTGPGVIEVVYFEAYADDAPLIVGDKYMNLSWACPPQLNGYRLAVPYAALATVSSSGIPTFQVANITQAWDMLTTKLTIDATELTSATAAAIAVVDTASSHDVLTTGDRIRVDVDVAGTGAKGASIALPFYGPG